MNPFLSYYTKIMNVNVILIIKLKLTKEALNCILIYKKY